MTSDLVMLHCNECDNIFSSWYNLRYDSRHKSGKEIAGKTHASDSTKFDPNTRAQSSSLYLSPLRCNSKNLVILLYLVAHLYCSIVLLKMSISDSSLAAKDSQIKKIFLVCHAQVSMKGIHVLSFDALLSLVGKKLISEAYVCVTLLLFSTQLFMQRL